jgi:hypothetical protein
MRDRASRELRESRRSGDTASKSANVKRAAGLKQLAANEEWLEGEKSRPLKNPQTVAPLRFRECNLSAFENADPDRLIKFLQGAGYDWGE